MNSRGQDAAAVVSRRGADRWVRGHPWIYASDVSSAPEKPGLVRVEDPRGKFIGQALDHPEILTVPETGYIKGAILEAMD